MAGANTSKWYFVGDSSSLEQSAKRSEAALDRLNATGKKAFGDLSGLAGGFGLALGVGGVAAGLKSAVDAARDAEAAQARLKTQLDALNLSFEQHRGVIDETIQAQSKLAALDDEELSDSFTTIVRVTGDVNEALKLNALAADIARGRQMELSAAAEIVAKVAAGNTGILSRYGIEIEKGATATEALGELQAKFAGQAKAYGDSNAGAADRAAVAWENAREELGAKLLPMLTELAEKFTEDILPAVERGAHAIDAVVDHLGGWERAAGFLLTGLMAKKIADVVGALGQTRLAMRALAVETAAASTVATGPQGLGKYLLALRIGIPAAFAFAMAETDEKGRKLGDRLMESAFPEVKAEREAKEAAEAGASAFAEVLAYLGVQKMAPTFQEITIAGKLQALKLGDTLGEETGEEFTSSLAEFLRLKFPAALVDSVAPAWEDIRKAAERAGIDTANAFTAGMAGAWSGQPFPGSAPGTVTPAPGGVPSLVFPLPSTVRFTRGGGPDAHASGGRGSNWQSLNAVDIHVKAGTPVLAVEAGVVESVSGRDPGEGTIRTQSGAVTYGYSVTIRSKANRYFYTHLDDVVVQANDPVKAGQVIGLVATWDQGNPHVHFAVERGSPEAIYNAPATKGFGTYPGPGYTPPSAPTVPGTTSSPTSTAPEPRARTSFPAIAGISDRLRARFDEANRQPGLALEVDPKTGKYSSVKVGPDMKALKTLADRIRTKELPALRKRIAATKRALKNLRKDRKDYATVRQSLLNKLAALQAEEQELRDLWEQTIAAWRDLKDAAAEDEDTGEEPVTSSSGPVGVVGLPGHDSPSTTDSPADSSADLQAELDQANRRAAASSRAAQLAGSFVSSLGIGVDANGNPVVTGGGGVTVVLNGLTYPPTPEVVASIGRTVAAAAGAQGFQPSTVESLGV